MIGSDLTLSYHGTTVVHGAGLRLAAGRVTALIGPNGSGKSTLLRALARLHTPDRGQVLLPAEDGAADGLDARALSSRQFARRVTLLAQSRPKPGGLTVADLVAFGRHPHRGRWGRGDDGGPAAIERAMRLTGVAPLAGRLVDQLSGGELQRVWLACCLAQDTTVLLLDEPTTHLDLRHQVALLDLIRELADEHGVTVGVVLHDLDQAAAVADHLVLLHRGHVRASGTPAQVLASDVLTATYGIHIDIDVDGRTGQITTRARGRYNTTRLAGVATG